MKQPKPVAPYSNDPSHVLDKILDRETGKPVSPDWLRSYADVLRGYHMHPETKFIGGRPTESGTLKRRHVVVDAINNIGKESDTWEEDEVLGASGDSVVTYGLSEGDREAIAMLIRAAPVRQLKAMAKVSADTIARVRADDPSVPDFTLVGMAKAARQLLAKANSEALEAGDFVSRLKALAAQIGVTSVASLLSFDPSNLAKILAGTRKPSRDFLRRARALQ